MTATDALSLPDAERLAERVLDLLDGEDSIGAVMVARVRSDLAGLRRHSQTSAIGLAPGAWCPCGEDEPCPYARQHSDGLLRTAAPYGVGVRRHSTQTTHDDERT